MHSEMTISLKDETTNQRERERAEKSIQTQINELQSIYSFIQVQMQKRE